MTIFVYGLHPLYDENQIRYVGITSCPKERFAAHLSSARRQSRLPVHSWIRNLIKKDQLPEMRLLARIHDDVDDWGSDERRWIALYRRLDLADLNVSDGGEGVRMARLSDEHRRKISLGLRDAYAAGRRSAAGAANPMWGKKQSIKQREAAALVAERRLISPEAHQRMSATAQARSAKRVRDALGRFR